jgi:hypothetical protein
MFIGRPSRAFLPRRGKFQGDPCARPIIGIRDAERLFWNCTKVNFTQQNGALISQEKTEYGQRLAKLSALCVAAWLFADLALEVLEDSDAY